ncbi:MAG: PIN domain-containing protein [bacterium]|nr:PIN domain-containing protein [bacterium]
MTETYFFDTYAFFEIIYGNPKYSKYKEAEAMTTIFNLAELSYGLKKEIDSKVADNFIEKYKHFLVEVKIEDLKEASNLKRKYKELSLPDVIGYVVAKRCGVKFLTGDEGFRNLENVEFVKK